MRQDVRSWRDESLEKLRIDEERQADKQYRTILSWLKVDEMEQSSIFDSITEEATKFPGTCDWLLKSDKISSWLQRKPDNPLLWLQGNPGTGKSVISTRLVAFLHASKSYVIHHFCTYNYASSTKYDNILRSLLLQLLRRNGELVAHVYHEYVIGRKLPTTSCLEQLLQRFLAAISEEPRSTEYVWIVIDGVDECEVARQARLVTLLNQIASRSSGQGAKVCKVLLTSRASQTMTKRLRKQQIISLSDESHYLGNAIQNYASQRLRSLHERFCQLAVDSDELQEIENLIAEKAQGEWL